jgi:outer membrane immunogenic protein
MFTIMARGGDKFVVKTPQAPEFVGHSAGCGRFRLAAVPPVLTISERNGGICNRGDNSMKKLLLASVSVVALAGSAFGADMAPMFKAPPPPVASWAGFYLGIDGGAARHDGSFNDFNGLVNAVIATSGLTPGSFVTSKSGGIAGGYAGYNFQDRSFVYGAEADIHWVGAKATETWGAAFAAASAGLQSQDIPWLATFRLRAGLDFESTLIYLTGGLAVGQVKDSMNVSCGTAPCFGQPGGALVGSFSESQTRLGWTAGVGFEHMFPSHWTVRGEFRYVDLGRSAVVCTSSATSVCSVPPTYHGEFSNTLMTGLVGVGYKF